MENIAPDILNLIIAYSVKEISEDDIKVLENWFNEKPENQEVFIEYVKLYQKTRRIGFLHNLDKERAWTSILSKLDKTSFNSFAPNETKVISLNRKRTVLRYIAAASVFIAISAGFYFNNLSSTNDSLLKKPAPSIVKVIVPGSDKAVLTLEDGSEVELKKGSTYSNNNAVVKGNQISYDDHTASPTTDAKTVYNYLSIPRGGQFFIELADKTKVWLNSESKLKFPVNFTDGKIREVELVYGEAYFEVSPSTNHKGARFKVNMKNQEIEVFGTQFNIKAYQNESQILTTLVEGSITLHLPNSKQKLIPGQQSILNKTNNKVTIKEVETQYEIGWKKGLFTFNNKSLKEIMNVLSRWYNVDIVFADKSLETVEFKGQINRDQNINTILQLIKKTNYISAYEIKNDIIILKK